MGKSHPAAPRTPEEAAEDERSLDAVMPELREFVEWVAERKHLTPKEAMNWAINYTKKKLDAYDKYETTSRCTRCKRLPSRCKCKPVGASADMRRLSLEEIEDARADMARRSSGER